MALYPNSLDCNSQQDQETNVAVTGTFIYRYFSGAIMFCDKTGPGDQKCSQKTNAVTAAVLAAC
jgi:hypothetical protein